MAQVAGTEIIFSDDFSTDGPIDSSKWNYNVWTPPSGGGSFYGNTQQRQELPTASGGAMNLRLDTYNASDPNHSTFLGSEAITKQLFDLSSGPIAFEARVRYAQDQRGLIGGFFTFAGPPDTHDEIDFEAMSNSFNQIQTNIYHNEPLGEGHPLSYPVTGSLSDYHTYRIEWLPNMVRWLVDGKEVRTETVRVPDKAMAMHFNIWGPPSSWPTGDASLKAAASQAQNQSFYFDVDSVKVEKLASVFGSTAHEHVAGTAAHEYLSGGAGDDSLAGAGGDDVIDGDAGLNTALYTGVARNFAMSIRAGEHAVSVGDRFGGEGTDTVSNVQSLQFADHSVDASLLVKAANLDASIFSQVFDFYTGYLDRAPDALGLYYWAGRLSDGMSLHDMAATFFHSDEAAAARPEGQSTTAIVSAAYADILGRSPDTDGLNYWVGELASGRLEAEDFLLHFVDAAWAPTSGSDIETLRNKADISAYFAIEQGLNDGDGGRAVFDAASLQAARDLTDSYAASAAAPESAGLVTKLVGIDIGEHAAG
ncbi:family 16 glycosylhydrolase [Chelatococcus sp. GCM10030263]|uniref:family 16 glycosylhydrolase n=1 Tax=Chelatococcus sp. GCM10030263 TaxID=3273387 RepID=UPI00360E9BFD